MLPEYVGENMAYHIMVSDSISGDNLLLDCYLGSAASIDFYWESVGRKLNLPIISTLTDRADSEEGLALAADSLCVFRDEIEAFEAYWINESREGDLPDGFLQGIKEILDGVNYAIANGLTLIVG